MLTDTIDVGYFSGDWEVPSNFSTTEKALTDVREQQEEYEFVSIGGELVLKAGLRDYASTLKEQNKQIRQSVLNHFEIILRTTPLPSRWKEEGVQEPTEECIVKTLSITKLIFSTFHLQPLRIAPSIEEGLMLSYWDPAKSRSLKIEIDNSLSVVGLINENKEIIKAIDITSESHIRELCNDFMR